MSKNKGADNFSKNLMTLCSYYKSISDVCRKVDINRQQFNRYLNGNTFPSYSNLKRLCDFFGVDQDEMVSDPIEFKKTISPTPVSEPTEVLPQEILEYVDILKSRGNNGIGRYVGYYYRYLLSGSFPGHILKSLIKIYKEGDFYYCWQIENITDSSEAVIHPFRLRYKGIVFMLSERIYIMEVESKLKSTISETIMMPGYQHGNKDLSGITCFTAPDAFHQPVSCRVFHQFIGENINVREALKLCDLFPVDSDAISKTIKNAIFTPALSPTETFFGHVR